MTTKQEIQTIYDNAIGTTNWYRHWTRHGYFTDGVKEVADIAGAHWLIDAIFSYNRNEPFQLWLLKVKEQEAKLTMQEDTGLKPLVEQEIAYTDFPEGVWKFYLENEVLMLSGER